MKKVFVLVLITLFLSAPLTTEAQGVPDARIGCFKFVNNLGFRDGVGNNKKAFVLELQEALFAKGYLSVSPTGYFGPLTKSAVIQYQKNKGIIQTGFVGPLTRGVLRSEFCGVTHNQDPKTLTDGCKVWFDGCNTCSRSTFGGPLMCTMMACSEEAQQTAHCKEYFFKLQTCPDEKIINKQPVVCVTTPCDPIETSYYILKGERKEISDFDASYVTQNCQVKETIVY